MFRLTAPKSGAAYHLFQIEFRNGGIPAITVAIPSDPNQSQIEMDLFSDYQGGRIGKEKSYRKIEISGDVSIEGDAFSDRIYAYKSAVSTQAAVDSINGVASGDSGAYVYTRPDMVDRKAYRNLGSYGDNTIIVGFTPVGSFNLGVNASGKWTSGKWDVSMETIYSLSWETVYETDAVLPTFKLAVSHSGHQEETNKRAIYTVRDVSSSGQFVIEASSRISRPTVSFETSWTIQEILYRPNGTVYWDKSRQGSPIGKYKNIGWTAAYIGVIPVVHGAEAIVRFLQGGDDTEKFKWHLVSAALNRIAETIDRDTKSADGTTIWSELQEQAIRQSIVISNNMWMFVRDCANLKEDFENLALSVKDAREGIPSGLAALPHSATASEATRTALDTIKKVDNVYLPVKYGYGLTVSEAHDLGEKILTLRQKYQALFDVFQLRSRQKVQTHLGLVTCNYLANVKLKDNKFSQLYGAVFNSGFYMTLKNAWDFVPYSFCVDWIVSVGDLLQTIDDYGYLCNLDAVSILRSVIVDSFVPVYKLYPFLAKYIIPQEMVQVKYYRRTVDRLFDPPPFKLSSPLVGQDMSEWSHYTELGALVTQRL